MTLGLISDTHGLLREAAIQALQGCGLIIHAGDVGKPEILDALRAIAPLIAVRGNIDTAEWAAALPESAEAVVEGVRIYIIHNVHDLNPETARGFDLVISGHSHKPSSVTRNGVLFLNPGAAGPRRFRLPVTVATVDLTVKPLEMKLIPLC